MANETWKFVQAKSKQAMKQVLGTRGEKTRMKVTPPLAVAPITQEDDMRWNPRQLHCFQYSFQPSRALRARSPRQACPRNIPQESSKFLTSIII